MSAEINLERLEDLALGPTLRAMEEGVGAIDEVFGDGYAKQNPVLLAGYMQAFATNLFAERLVYTVGEQLNSLGCSIEQNDVSSGINGLDSSLDRIADMIYRLANKETQEQKPYTEAKHYGRS